MLKEHMALMRKKLRWRSARTVRRVDVVEAVGLFVPNLVSNATGVVQSVGSVLVPLHLHYLVLFLHRELARFLADLQVFLRLTGNIT